MPPDKTPAPPNVPLQNAARTGLLHAVNESGIPAKTIAQAWAQLVAVQTEIALNASGGAKATAAAKFVAGAAGLPLVTEQAAPQRQFLITEQQAHALLRFLKDPERKEDT